MKNGKEKRKKDFLKLVGATATREILEFLNTHGPSRYRQLSAFVNTHTLDARLRALRSFNLVEHHFEKGTKRKEWYEITEKGKILLRHMEELLELAED